MKYSLEGIKDSRVIEDVMIDKKSIHVFYLDMSSDVFENREITFKKITEQEEKQFQNYISNFEAKQKELNSRIRSSKNKAKLILLAFIVSAGLALSVKVAAPFSSFAFVSVASLSTISGLLSAINFRKAKKASNKLEDIKKYVYFKRYRHIFEEGYKKIIEKENMLIGKCDVKLKKVTLHDLDVTSLRELRDMVVKYYRYTDVDKSVDNNRSKKIGSHPQS